jgi:ribonuclease HII
MLLIGVDEAGYGPNLGPLAVVATAWRLPPAVDAAASEPPDLYDLLGDAVTHRPSAGLVAIADSKLLYGSGSGLDRLETGVLAALALRSAVGRWPATWDELVTCTAADPGGRGHELPWSAEGPRTLPYAADPGTASCAAALLTEACAAAGIQVAEVRARLVHPAEFNALTEQFGTKGAALSHVTLETVRALLDGVASGGDDAAVPVHVVCDKHGGRNRYGALLQHHFPEAWILTDAEGRATSRYRCDGPHGRLHFQFRTGGEAFLPAALASMTAKYLRELSMAAFNAYWQREVPGLRPTAGYPVDARRFLGEIAARQRALGIADQLLWRKR